MRFLSAHKKYYRCNPVYITSITTSNPNNFVFLWRAKEPRNIFNRSGSLKQKTSKMKKTILFASLLLAGSVAFAQKFKINGTVQGLENGTWLYLESSSPEDGVKDSTQVNDGIFTFKGTLKKSAIQVILRTKKYTNYVFFWAENKDITMLLKDGQFKSGTITGSVTQTENEEIQKLIKPIDLKDDSLRVALGKSEEPAIKNELRKQIAEIKNEIYNVYLNYAKAHPSSIVVASATDVYSTTWGKEKTQRIYQLFSPNIKATDYGKNINSFLALSQEIKIGGKYVDFEQTNALGKKIKLSDIKGKYILLEFWGSWCGPCRQDNPELVKTYNAYKSKGFEILGVAADNDKAQWLKAIKDDGLPWENVTDLKGNKNDVVFMYGISAYPTNYLIDENGIIIAKDLRGKKLSDKLAELLP